VPFVRAVPVTPADPVALADRMRASSRHWQRKGTTVNEIGKGRADAGVKMAEVGDFAPKLRVGR
jgi:hypothetical protein